MTPMGRGGHPARGVPIASVVSAGDGRGRLIVLIGVEVSTASHTADPSRTVESSIPAPRARAVTNVRVGPVTAMTSRALQRLLKEVDAPYVVDDVSHGRVRLRLPASEAHVRPGGTISGPALMALADGAAWAAVLSHIGPKVDSVSSSLHIDFLRRPPPVDVIADGHVLKLGRSLAVIDVSIHSARSDALVAKAQVTYVLPPDSEEAGPRVEQGPTA